MKKTILITGGNGYLGSHLVKRLVDDYDILILENNVSDLNRIVTLLDKLKIYRFDTNSIHNIFNEQKVDIIFHLATDYGKNDNFENTAVTNLLMPLSLLNNAIINNVEIFINIDTVLNKNVNDYSFSKKQFLEWLEFKKDLIKVVNIRLEHFYGEFCSKNNFITMLIHKLLNNVNYIDLTLGEQIRNFVYYSDIIDAFELILKKAGNFNQYSEFEVSTNENISIKDLVEKIKLITKSDTRLNFGKLPYRDNELMIHTSNNSKLIELGWSPKISLEEGLNKTIELEKKN